MTLQRTKIAVVGGGIVGSALALGLAQRGLAVTVIERAIPTKFNASAQPDVRISALGVASINLMRRLGVWDNIRSMRVHPYCRLEIWEWENAHVTFKASELKLPQLGYMVENNVLKQALWQAMEMHPNVTLHVPFSLTSLCRDKQGYHLTLNDGTELMVTMVVGADGANSKVRQMANIGIYTWQYQQSCMLITVKCTSDPGEITWQHFTPKGPHAFLPLFDHWASLVWYDVPSRIHQLQKLSMPQLAREIECHFPAKLGKVTPVAVGVFPLTLSHALKYTYEGIALVGDAAHTVHPLAGQGVNLGYRDVNALLDMISSTHIHDKSYINQLVLTRYQRKRMVDNFIMQLGINLFYVGFGNDLWPLRILRNIGLIMAERSGILKRQMLKYALGL